jgi:ABC-type transport system substrate-binding protein
VSDNYWVSTLQKRLSRRRAMVASGAGALGAAFLAACGGSDSGDSGAKSTAPKDASGLLFEPTDTTKQAVKGGVWESFAPSYPEGFDVYRGDNITFFHTVHSYQRLVSYKNGFDAQPGDGSVEGDATASWEISPDNTQVTFKLRQNNKWDQRPPTNSRVLTTQDVKYSWDKISATSAPNGRELVNARNPDAPITSMTFPDNNTVVVKLKEPMSAILGMLAYSWYFSIIPMEAEDKFEVKQDMRGTGPWMLTQYQPGQRFEYKRNPNYWRPDRPLLDGINYPIITEPAQQLAQFKAKRHWGGGGNILGGTYLPTADLVLTTKKENPEALMRALSPFTGQSGKNDIVPSKLDGSIFWDIRLRQAISMLLDRDAFIDAFGNVPALTKEGIPMETGWHGFTPAAWKAYGAWVDPKDAKAYGPDAKHYQFSPDEAAKLMKAAGKYPIETEYTFSGTLPFSTPTYKSQNQVIIEMLQQGGHFKFTKINTPDHFSVYDPKYLFGHGQYEGLSPEPFGTWPDFDMGIWAIYMPGGRNDYVYKPVPKANDLAKQHRREFDRNKRLQIAHDWEKAMAAEMPTIPWPGPGTWTQFGFHWPWLANVGGVNAPITTAQQADTFQHFWYDKSKDTRSA